MTSARRPPEPLNPFPSIAALGCRRTGRRRTQQANGQIPKRGLGVATGRQTGTSRTKGRWGEVRQDLLEVFGEDLKDLRTAAGLNRHQLAERSLMHSTEVGLLERGQREPRLGTMIRLSVALDVPFGRLGESPIGWFEYQTATGWRGK